MKISDYEKILPGDIEKMLYLIAAFGNVKEGRRFNNLPFERQQKVTYLLQTRINRRGVNHEPLDYDTIREVIDDAKKNIFNFEV